MGRVTVITNNKGGVAKTTTAVNLASALRRSGLDVLCIDLDGQSNLTDIFGVDASAAPGTTFDAIKTKDAPFVKPTRVVASEGKAGGVLDVLPSSLDMFAAEALLSNEADRILRLCSVVDRYRDFYDVIIIDTTPTMGLLTISALYAADDAVITTNADFLSSRGLVSLRDTINSINENRKLNPLAWRVLLCRYDKRKSLHRLTADQVKAAFPAYRTIIRNNVSLEEAPAVPCDIFTYAPRSYGAQDYKAFAEEYVKAYKVKHTKHSY